MDSPASHIKEFLRGVAAPILLVNTHGQVEMASEVALRLLGRGPDDVAGVAAGTLIPGLAELPERAPERVHLPLADGTEQVLSVALDRSDLLPGLVIVLVQPVAELHSNAAWSEWLEASPDAVVGVRSTGDIVFVNRQTEALFGYSRAELESGHLDMLLPEAVRAVHPHHRRGYFQNPQQRPMGAGLSLHGKRSDGTLFPVEISLSTVHRGNELIALASIRDVTERIEAQRERDRLAAEAEWNALRGQLNQSRRLESLGQLAGGVAHDFNNLLGAILGYAGFVAETVGQPAEELTPEDMAALRSDVGQIIAAAERAGRLTHQLLAFARRELVQPEVLDLNAVVRDVEHLLRRTIGERIALRAVLDPSLRSVLADRGQIEQVLVNLAVNARDAMPGGGALTVDTSNIEVDTDYAAMHPGLTEGPHVQVRVSDSGSGMSRETLERAFEPFFTTKAEGEGTGLGLATVYGIVQQTGGSIRLYSEEGLGTTVTILLPAVDGEGEPIPAQTPEAQPAASGTILLVEDEAALRDVTERILLRAGYRVLVADSGQRALEIAQVEPRIDLLLTDVVMPQMGGQEVAERLRAERPGLKILFMSGYAQPFVEAQGEMGPVDLVPKPFTARNLTDRVGDLLRNPPTP